jgi:nitrite reductase/ring-hydroxylating ferredoxin subunit
MIDDNSIPTPNQIKSPLAAITLQQIPDGRAIGLDLDFKTGRQSVIVTRRGGAASAFINLCPHARWPLDTFDGRFLFTPEGDLMCAAHGAIFDALTGKCLGGPGTGAGLTRVPLTQVGEGLEIVE